MTKTRKASRKRTKVKREWRKEKIECFEAGRKFEEERGEVMNLRREAT